VFTCKGKINGVLLIVINVLKVIPALTKHSVTPAPADPPENKIPLCFGILEPIVIGFAWKYLSYMLQIFRNF